MPEGLDELFAQAEAEFGGGDNEVVDTDSDTSFDLSDDAVQVDTPDSESTDVVEGDTEAEGDNPEGIVEEAFDWQQYADQLVPITDNGEETKVSLKDLRDGFMRQSDYTRKTQGLAEKAKMAEWAESVQNAFDRDPAGTLRAFAEAYGLIEQGQQREDTSRFDELDEDVRPFAEQTLQAQQQLAAMQQRLEQFENQRIQDEVRSEIQGMHARYGADFDAENTLRVAASYNVGLEEAHTMLMGQRFMQSQQTQTEATKVADTASEAAAAAAEQQRQAAKKRASNTNTGSFKASDIPADNFSDIGELMEQVIASSS